MTIEKIEFGFETTKCIYRKAYSEPLDMNVIKEFKFKHPELLI